MVVFGVVGLVAKGLGADDWDCSKDAERERVIRAGIFIAIGLSAVVSVAVLVLVAAPPFLRFDLEKPFNSSSPLASPSAFRDSESRFHSNSGSSVELFGFVAVLVAARFFDVWKYRSSLPLKLVALFTGASLSSCWWWQKSFCVVMAIYLLCSGVGVVVC